MSAQIICTFLRSLVSCNIFVLLHRGSFHAQLTLRARAILSTTVRAEHAAALSRLRAAFASRSTSNPQSSQLKACVQRCGSARTPIPTRSARCWPRGTSRQGVPAEQGRLSNRLVADGAACSLCQPVGRTFLGAGCIISTPMIPTRRRSCRPARLCWMVVSARRAA